MIEALSHPATAAFIVGISLFCVYFHVRFNHANANKAPAFLTTCGIFGTFVGIIFGLMDFNANNVQESVPSLINGIKTAFWASAWGVGAALTIKIREAFFGVPKIVDDVYQGATVDDLATLLQDVKTALIGNDEATLIGQIRHARQDSNDRLDAVRKSFEAFAEKAAENNSKALIEALREVIRDFNTQINDQFGDNFKQLNYAVGGILEWQEKYRLQMAEMIQQQAIVSETIASISDNMVKASSGYTTVIEKSSAFENTATSLKNLLENCSENLQMMTLQRQQLEDALKALADLIIKASTGLPSIDEKVTSIVSQLSESVRLTGDELRNTLLQNVNEMTRSVANDVRVATHQLTDGVLTSNNEYKKLLIDTIEKSNTEFNTSLQRMSKETNDSVTHIVEKTRGQVEVVNKALEDQLTQSLQSLGTQLASLSSRFVEDYTPLTSRLREIVELSRRAG